MNRAKGLLAWNALRRTQGLGPKRLAALARVLATQRTGASELLGKPADELITFGISPSLAEVAASNLARPSPPIPAPHGAAILCPDDDAYPLDRLTAGIPLPVILYCRGELSLLSAGGLAVSGSRSAPPQAIDYAFEVSMLCGKAGINVVSGHAAGTDESGHAGALAAGGSTTVVLAEGLTRFDPRPGLRQADEDRVLVVSEFEPQEPWSAFRAMQRNATISGLADVVLVVAAGLSGGAWAQGEHSLRSGRKLLVPSFSSSLAPGNEKLIDLGAIPLDPSVPASVLEHLADQPRRAGVQLDLLN